MTLLISRLAVSAPRIAEAYVPSVLSAMIGIFYNRFSDLGTPTSECLSTLVSRHGTSALKIFVNHFEEILSRFQALSGQRDNMNVTGSPKCSGMI